MPGNDLISGSLNKSSALVGRPNTPAEKKRAVEVVCGSPHTAGASDARIILEALGLIDPKKESHG